MKTYRRHDPAHRELILQMIRDGRSVPEVFEVFCGAIHPNTIRSMAEKAGLTITRVRKEYERADSDGRKPWRMARTLTITKAVAALGRRASASGS